MAETIAPLPDGFQLDAPVASTPAASAGLPAGFSLDPPAKPQSVASDVGKAMIGNAAPNAAVNLAAGAVSAPATAMSYGTQLATKTGEYLTEDAINAYRSARGEPPVSPEEFALEQKDFKNAIRQKFGLQSTNESGDIADYVPTPSGVLSGVAKEAGMPLYQPKTDTGQALTTLANIASGGLGSGARALPAIAGAVGATGAQSVAKATGAGDQGQFFAGLAGGAGAGLAGAGLEGTPALNKFGSPESVAAKQADAVTPEITPPEPPKVGSEALRDRAKPYYKYADDQGVDFTPEAQQGVVSDINSAFAKTGKMNARLHGDTLSVMGDMKNDVENGKLDMEDLHQYRQLFGDVVNNNLYENGKMKPDAMKASQAIDQIDNTLEDAKSNPDKMLTNGSPEAIEAWQKGQQLWASAARANDIERVMQRAEFMQNPATSMRQGFASLAGNPKRFNRFSPEQQELITDATQAGLGGEALRAIGSRLVAIATLGAHNPLGAVAAIPISAAARNLSTRFQAARGQKVIDNITDNAPGEFQAPAAKPAALQLPPPNINVPPEGFSPPAAPAAAEPVPRAPSSNALPPPREMSYEDMAKNGRILQSPEKTPINMPAGAVKQTYNPNNLNTGDEHGFANAKNLGLDTARLKASQAQKALELNTQHEQSVQKLQDIANGVPAIKNDQDFKFNGGNNDDEPPTPNARKKAVNESDASGERQQPAPTGSGGGKGGGSNSQTLLGSSPLDEGFVDKPAGAGNLKWDEKGTPYRDPPQNTVNANLSAATPNIKGISNLLDQANKGDKAAHGLLNNIAYDSLDRLTSGIPSAKVVVDRNSGLYGGSVEPSLGVRMDFDPQDRPAVLAALAKFADNFKQEQIHVREGSSDPVGSVYDDGSYVTPVHRITLNKPMSQKQVQNIVDKTGLPGFTVNDKYLETYYVGDPDDTAAQQSFKRQANKAVSLIGSNAQGHDVELQRLWAYGEGGIPYDQVRGDVPQPQKTDTDIPRQIAENVSGKSVTPAEQAKTVTPQQKATQQQIARDYEKLPDNDLKNPLVQKAYGDLNKEVVKQYNHLPIKVDAWADKNGGKWVPRGGEPYKSSDDMRNDILNNNHLYIFTTSKGQFGPEGVDMTGHPLLESTGIKSDNGYPMLANDVFRAVHDYYAHLLSPTEFGPKGEEAAWKNHVATINSPMARWALTSETRGQNSWVNFGDHVDPSSAQRDRPFARQKAALLPIEHSMTGDKNLDAPMQKLAKSLTPEQRKGSLGKTNTSGE